MKRLNKVFQLFSFSFLLLLMSSCDKYYVSVNQQWIDAQYLASTHVGTPDPRQANPPVGQMLVVDWRVPQEVLKRNPHIELDVVFWDYSEKVICHPIKKRMGWFTYKLLNEEYEKSRGILTYKAEIVTEDGEIFREWKHQLWVNLITVNQEEDLQEPIEESP